MEAFFSDVAVIKGILEKVRKHLAKLQAAHEESRTATRGETMKRLRASMSAIIEETSVSAREAKLRLENLDAANARAMMRPGAGEGTSEARTRTTVATSMKMKHTYSKQKVHNFPAKVHKREGVLLQIKLPELCTGSSRNGPQSGSNRRTGWPIRRFGSNWVGARKNPNGSYRCEPNRTEPNRTEPAWWRSVLVNRPYGPLTTHMGR